MPYQAIGSDEFKKAAQGSYTANVAHTLNEWEVRGYRLVGIEPAVSDDDRSIFVLYREEPEVKRSGSLHTF